MLLDYLNEKGNEGVEDLKQSLAPVSATGNLVRSIRHEATESTLKIFAASYIDATEVGTKPTGVLIYKAIKDWINAKGISPMGGMSKNSLAFLIARKIKEKGTLLHYTTDYYGNTKPSGRVSEPLERLKQSILKDIAANIKVPSYGSV